MSKKSGAERAHAKFSASGSLRWLNCPGSIALSEKAPVPPESKWGLEGTQAHTVLEFLIKNRKQRGKASEVLRQKNPTSMIIHGEMALNWIEERLAKLPGAELHSEIRCDLPVSEPDQFGTTDIAIIEHFGKLIVVDYKYGAGIPIPAEENTQLIYYALGIAHKYDYNFSSVEIVIIQPRAQIDGKYIRTWETTIENLIEWREMFERGIKAAKRPDAPLRVALPGEEDYCRFCPAKIICPEIGQKKIRQAQIDFDTDKPITVGLTPVVAFSHQKVGQILNAAGYIDKWLESVREYAIAQLELGVPIPGWKLVEKRGARKWIDLDRIEPHFRKNFDIDAYMPRDILSPAAFEKLGVREKKFVEKFSVSVSSGMTLGRDEEGRGTLCDFEDAPVKTAKTVKKKQK